MKRIISLPFLAVFFLLSCSKSATNDSAGGTATIIAASAVPQATRTAFSNDFSGASAVEWQRNSGSFTVQFNLSNQRHDAGYDDNGHRSSHSIICLDAAVPQAVLDAFRQQFPSDNVYEWNLRNDGTWKAHFMRGAVKWEATFNATGGLIKVEKA